MTTSFDASRYQQALERWRALAERRLEHMTALYESGRWRRYYTEERFMRIILDTRAAAAAWGQLAPKEEAAPQLEALMREGNPAGTDTRPSPSSTLLPELA